MGGGYHDHHGDKDHDWDWESHEDRGHWEHHGRGDGGGKHWTPKPDGNEDMKWGADKQTGEEGKDGDEGMSDHMKMKIMAASIVAAVLLIVALVVITVICCKSKKSRATASAQALKKKNPFQADPEKAKPSAKEIEAMQSAPPVMHALPAVVLGPLPTAPKGEKRDYTAPPENPREQMALWSPPPAYVEEMPKAV